MFFKISNSRLVQCDVKSPEGHNPKGCEMSLHIRPIVRSAQSKGASVMTFAKYRLERCTTTSQCDVCIACTLHTLLCPRIRLHPGTDPELSNLTLQVQP